MTLFPTLDESGLARGTEGRFCDDDDDDDDNDDDVLCFSFCWVMN